MCFSRQTSEPCDHQIHDVVGVSLCVNAAEVPGPTRRVVIEVQEFFFGERSNELNGEERIAVRLLVHQLCKRRGALRRAVKRICDQLPDMRCGERRQRDLLYFGAGALHAL